MSYLAKVYVNNKLFSVRISDEEFHTAYRNIMCRPVVGNTGKGKGTGAEGVLLWIFSRL